MRTHRAFVPDGQSVYGVSVFCALDDIGPGSLDGPLGSRLSTDRWVHMPTARQQWPFPREVRRGSCGVRAVSPPTPLSAIPGSSKHTSTTRA